MVKPLARCGCSALPSTLAIRHRFPNPWRPCWKGLARVFANRLHVLARNSHSPCCSIAVHHGTGLLASCSSSLYKGLDSDTLSFRPCLTEASSCVQIICIVFSETKGLSRVSPVSFSAEASLQAMRQPYFFRRKCLIACVRITALLLTTAAQQPEAQLPPDTATEQGESVCMVEVSPTLFVALRSCLLSLARAVWRAPSHIQGGLLSHMVQRAGR